MGLGDRKSRAWPRAPAYKFLNKTASPPQAWEVPGQPTQDPSSSKSGEYEQMGRWKDARWACEDFCGS